MKTNRIKALWFFLVCFFMLSWASCEQPFFPSAQTGLFSISYHADNATSGTAPVDSREYNSGATLTILGCPSDLKKEGYSFDGWSTNEIGPAEYFGGEEIVIDSDVSLYAQWRKIQISGQLVNTLDDGLLVRDLDYGFNVFIANSIDETGIGMLISHGDEEGALLASYNPEINETVFILEDDNPSIVYKIRIAQFDGLFQYQFWKEENNAIEILISDCIINIGSSPYHLQFYNIEPTFHELYDQSGTSENGISSASSRNLEDKVSRIEFELVNHDWGGQFQLVRKFTKAIEKSVDYLAGKAEAKLETAKAWVNRGSEILDSTVSRISSTPEAVSQYVADKAGSVDTDRITGFVNTCKNKTVSGIKSTYAYSKKLYDSFDASGFISSTSGFISGTVSTIGNAVSAASESVMFHTDSYSQYSDDGMSWYERDQRELPENNASSTFWFFNESSMDEPYKFHLFRVDDWNNADWNTLFWNIIDKDSTISKPLTFNELFSPPLPKETPYEEPQIPVSGIEYHDDQGLLYIRDGENPYWSVGEDPDRRSGKYSVKEFIIAAQIDRFPVTIIRPSGFSGYSLKSVIMPESLEYIGARAFADCWQLQDILLPNGVEYIGDSAFSDTALSQINLPDGTRYVGQHAFKGSGIDHIDLPDDIWAMQSYSLSGYPLQTVSWPTGISVIPDRLFNRSPIRQISIPEGVIEIQEFAFSFCENLTSISLPGSLRIIGQYSFRATNLTSVTIPEGVVEIGESAFESSKLQYLYLPQTILQYREWLDTDENLHFNWYWNFSYQNTPNATLYLPAPPAPNSDGSMSELHSWHNYGNVVYY